MIYTARPMLKISNIRQGVVISLSALMVASYSPETALAQSNPTTQVHESTGFLETSRGTYLFTPSTCAVYKGDGIDDIEIQGSGTAPDGEKIFVELSSTANALTIGFGVDSPFANADREFKAGRAASQEFSIVVSDNEMSITGLVLVDGNGEPVDSIAILKINCGS